MRRSKTQTQRSGHVRTETALGRLWPQAKGYLEPSGTGRGKKDPPHSLQREPGPATPGF